MARQGYLRRLGRLDAALFAGSAPADRVAGGLQRFGQGRVVARRRSLPPIIGGFLARSASATRSRSATGGSSVARQPGPRRPSRYEGG
jgi:hypothetical protein